MFSEGDRVYWHCPETLLWHHLRIVERSEEALKAVAVDDCQKNGVAAGKSKSGEKLLNCDSSPLTIVIKKQHWFRIRKEGQASEPLPIVRRIEEGSLEGLAYSRPTRRNRQQATQVTSVETTLQDSPFIPGEIIQAIDRRCEWYLAQLLPFSSTHFRIHYFGFHRDYDEFCPVGDLSVLRRTSPDEVAFVKREYSDELTDTKEFHPDQFNLPEKKETETSQEENISATNEPVKRKFDNDDLTIEEKKKRSKTHQIVHMKLPSYYPLKSLQTPTKFPLSFTMSLPMKSGKKVWTTVPLLLPENEANALRAKDLCSHCGSGASSRPTDSFNNTSQLVSCSICGDTMHRFCRPPKSNMNNDASINMQRWRCLACFQCDVCQDHYNGSDLLFCVCGLGVHKCCVKGNTYQCKACKKLKAKAGNVERPCLEERPNPAVSAPSRLLAAYGISVKNTTSPSTNLICESQEASPTAAMFDITPTTLENDPRKCNICMNFGDDVFAGRLLPLAASSWVHVGCMFWSDIIFDDNKNIFKGVEKVISSSRKSICSSCGKPGASVRCFADNCKNSYHYACARQNGCYFTYNCEVKCSEHGDKQHSLRSHKLRYPILIAQSMTISNIHALLKSGGVLRMGSISIHSFGRPDETTQTWALFTTETGMLCGNGYRASRIFWSWSRENERCTYWFEVKVEGNKVCYTIAPESAPNQLITGKTASEVVRILWHKVANKQPFLVRRPSIYGDYFFGLTLYPVRYVYESLVADWSLFPKFKRIYPRLKNDEPLQDDKPDDNILEENNRSGRAARTEPYVKVKKIIEVRSKNTILPTARPEASTSSTSITILPTAMKYRQLREQARRRTRVAKSNVHGWGLFTTEPIEANEMVIEYVGEVISIEISNRREEYYLRRNLDMYLFRLDQYYVVDATLKGNQARFINHSCDPNCHSKIISVDGVKKIVIVSLRRIEKGEELSYDYKLPLEEEKIICGCGATNCRGRMN